VPDLPSWATTVSESLSYTHPRFPTAKITVVPNAWASAAKKSAQDLFVYRFKETALRL